jgi:methanogenic corrinoid protein MtbC1
MIVKYVESALEQFSSLPQSLPSYIVSSNPLADVANEYLNALLLLNRKGAEVTIRKHLERGLRLRDLVDQVVLPVQLEVGRLWQEKRITVVQEHYCTAATEMLLTELRERFRGIPRDVTALALCPEGEHHCLGIRLLSELLEADGWRVAYIGPNCPSADVLNHLRDTKTDLVAISVTTALSMAALRQLIMKVREVKASTAPRILVGGRALGTDPRLPRSLRADGYAANIFDGLALANRLVAMRKTSSA